MRKIVCLECGSGMSVVSVSLDLRFCALMKCKDCGSTCMASERTTNDWRTSDGLPIEFTALEQQSAVQAF